MNKLQKDLIKLQPMMESLLSEVNCCRERVCADGKRTGTETANDSIWSYKLNLANFPTKPENLHVKCENENLIISGKSKKYCIDCIHYVDYSSSLFKFIHRWKTMKQN